jgi:hypothetical protein
VTAEQKKIRTALEEFSMLTVDRVICRKTGEVEVQRGYFYRHGGSAEKFGAKVVAALEFNGIKTRVVRTEDRFRMWPKDSYFAAVIVPAA